MVGDSPVFRQVVEGRIEGAEAGAGKVVEGCLEQFLYFVAGAVAQAERAETEVADIHGAMVDCGNGINDMYRADIYQVDICFDSNGNGPKLQMTLFAGKADMHPIHFIKLFIASLLLLAGGQTLAVTKVLECNSDKHRTRVCPVERIIKVELVQQLSSARCAKGKTWGYDQNGVWVKLGCRGRFRVEHGRVDSPPHKNDGKIARTDVFCADKGRGSNHCPADTRGKVRLLHQFSRKECRRGTSWGIDRRGIWVDKGCIALFRVSRRTDPPARRETFRCGSEDFMYVRCEILFPSKIRFHKQLSRVKCVKEKNWGFDAKGVWVKEGCRAQFKAEIRVDEQPQWLVGRFKGYDKWSDEEITLRIRRNGVVRARIEGRRVPVELEGDLLMLDRKNYVLSKTRKGFKAESTVSGGYRTIRFRRDD